MHEPRKKIVLAITLAEPGGAQSFVLRLAQWLKIRGEEVTVLAGEGEWLFAKCREAGINIERVPHLGREIRLWNDIRAYLALKKILRRLKPDAIHLNSAKMGVIGSLSAHSLRTRPLPRVIYRIGGWTFLEPQAAWKQWLYRQAERWTARFKDTIICVHPGDETLARQLAIRPRGQLVTIPNGIDLPSFDATLKIRDEARAILSEAAHSSLLTTHFLFGTVANFYPAKNLPRYLEVCRAVSDAEPDARVVIFGDGPERSTIERRIQELHLQDRVLLLGMRDDASTLLSAFDAFVLPSVKEGMSWALLEAMAAGLPCIANDVGANRWMLEDAGWIVEAQHPDALVSAMRHVMRADDRQERGKKLRQIVERRFPLQATLAQNAAYLT